MKNGTTVYHVAFPDVRAQVYGDHTDTEKWIMVLFDRPVMFKRTGRHDIWWRCSRNLLFPSSSQATAAHDPNYDSRQDMDLIVDKNGDIKVMAPSFEEMRRRCLEGYEPTLERFSVSGEVICKHEWVTWTGLRGTITDCTKCKAVKS